MSENRKSKFINPAKSRAFRNPFRVLRYGSMFVIYGEKNSIFPFPHVFYSNRDNCVKEMLSMYERHILLLTIVTDVKISWLIGKTIKCTCVNGCECGAEVLEKIRADIYE